MEFLCRVIQQHIYGATAAVQRCKISSVKAPILRCFNCPARQRAGESSRPRCYCPRAASAPRPVSAITTGKLGLAATAGDDQPPPSAAMPAPRCPWPPAWACVCASWSSKGSSFTQRAPGGPKIHQGPALALFCEPAPSRLKARAAAGPKSSSTQRPARQPQGARLPHQCRRW